MPKKLPRTKAPHGMMKKLTLLAAAAAMSAVLSASRIPLPMAAKGEGDAPVQRARDGRVVMYAMDAADLTLRDADVSAVDQINYSFALIKDGRADGTHWKNQKKVTAYLKRHPHIDGVLAVGGWGAEGFSDACLTEEGRVALAESILDLMDVCGFVGVDIDWEYPGVSGTGITSRTEDVENWYALLTLLREGLDAREALHGREYILSVALGAGETHLSAVDAARLAGLVDQAVVMAYDLCGFDRMTGHHAGLYPAADRPNTGARAVRALIQGGMPAEKLLLGMPAYGRVWRQVNGDGNGLNQRANTSGNKTIPFDAVLRLTEEGYTAYYDEEAQAAWWYDGTNFVSAENDRSIARKGEWIRENGLLGAAVWQVAQDASGAMLGMLHAAMQE